MKKKLTALILAVTLLAVFLPVLSASAENGKIRLTCVEGTPSQHGLPPENCFDGDDHTKWCVTGNAVYVIFKAEKATKIAGYSLTTADDNNIAVGRNPRDWTFSGSNDGENWTVLDTRTGCRKMKDVNFTAYIFGAEAKEAYQYFKLDVTRIVNGSCIQLSEIGLVTDPSLIPADDKEQEEETYPSGLKFIDGTGSPYGCPPENLVDGMTQTKWCHSEQTSFVTFESITPVAIAGYKLVTADDNNTSPGRNPKDWTLYGSNDLESWQIIDQVKNDNKMRDVNFTPFSYKLKKQAPEYRYFRLEVTRIANGQCLQLSEIQLVTDPDELEDVAEAENFPVGEVIVPYKTATVDGVVSEGEWDGATALVLNVEDTRGWYDNGAGIVGDTSVISSHTNKDFTSSVRLMYADGYLYYLEERTDTTPFYGSSNELRAYCQDSTLFWLYNSKTKMVPDVFSVFAKNSDYNDGKPYIVYAAGNNQDGAIELNIEIQSTVTENGFVIEAKIPLSETTVSEKDMALGYIRCTFCSVNIFNQGFSGNAEELWTGFGYQAQYTGVEQWRYSPSVVLTGREYDYQPDTEPEEDDEWETDPGANTETKAAAASGAAVTDAPGEKESGGLFWYIVAGAAVVIIAACVIVILKTGKKK